MGTGNDDEEKNHQEESEVKNSVANNSEESPDSEPDLVNDEEYDSGKVNSEGWRELMGKDIVFRLTSNEEQQKPAQQGEVGDLLRVSFRGYILAEDQSKDEELFEQQDDYILVLGDADVTPGLEMGIRFCPLGSSAEVRCTSKYAYGPLGRKGSDTNGWVAVPPSATLHYIFSVHEVLTNIRVLDVAIIKKEIGNDSFRFDLDLGTKALRCWNKAVEHLDSLPETDPNQEEKLKAMVDLYNNIALVHFQRKEYSQSKTACFKITEGLDPNNFKAWVRLSYVYLDMDADFDQVENTIHKASDLAPEGMQHKEIQRFYTLCKKKKKLYKQKQKEISAKMMKDYEPITNINKEQMEAAETVVEKVDDTPTKSSDQAFIRISLKIVAVGFVLAFLFQYFYKH